MASLVSYKYFKFNPKINRELVEIHKNRCNMTELGRKSNMQHEQLYSAHVGAV